MGLKQEKDSGRKGLLFKDSSILTPPSSGRAPVTPRVGCSLTQHGERAEGLGNGAGAGGKGLQRMKGRCVGGE